MVNNSSLGISKQADTQRKKGYSNDCMPLNYSLCTAQKFIQKCQILQISITFYTAFQMNDSNETFHFLMVQKCQLLKEKINGFGLIGGVMYVHRCPTPSGRTEKGMHKYNDFQCKIAPAMENTMVQHMEL